MAKMAQLFRKQRHSTQVGIVTRVFNVEVYKTSALTKASIKVNGEDIRGPVEVEGYGFIIKERRNSGESFYTWDRHDTGVITSRTGEVTYALAQIQKCKSTDEIRKLMKGLKKEYRVALKRDAEKELKKSLGIYTPITPKVRSNKKHQPVPQIRLPWME